MKQIGDEEIMELRRESGGMFQREFLLIKQGADAQLEADKESVRELFEESEKVCMEHGMRKKRKCDKCWQALKERWLG